jgi:hypothetical protein
MNGQKQLLQMQKDDTLIIAYNKLKEQYDSMRHSETIKKYILLSKAQTIARKLYGRSYSVSRLSLDFEIPYTTVKRCLALERANKNTWRLIREGKITSFKVAQALSTKSRHFQDELIDLIIKKNLSTYEIRKVKIHDEKDIRIARQKIAINRGYSRESSAYYSFDRAIKRMSDFLTIDKSFLPKDKLPTIKLKLIKLEEEINSFIKQI